jgi:hypothetical protein
MPMPSPTKYRARTLRQQKEAEAAAAAGATGAEAEVSAGAGAGAGAAVPRVFSSAAKAWAEGRASLTPSSSAGSVEVLDVRRSLKHANSHHEPSLRPCTGPGPGRQSS